MKLNPKLRAGKTPKFEVEGNADGVVNCESDQAFLHLACGKVDVRDRKRRRSWGRTTFTGGAMLS